MPFYLYFGLLGIVVGGVVVWLLNAAHPFEIKEEPWRPPDEVEPGFLAREMAERGRPLDEATVAELLELHMAYLDGRIREEQARTAALRIESARAELSTNEAATGSGGAVEPGSGEVGTAGTSWTGPDSRPAAEAPARTESARGAALDRRG